MATERQIAANRSNSLRSTGPRTRQGKAASRFNAVKHGLLADAALLPDEDPADVRALRDAIHEQLEPQGELETMLADRVTSCLWRLRRVLKVEAGLFVKEQYEEVARSAREQASRYTVVTSEALEQLLELVPQPTLRITNEEAYAEAIEQETTAKRMLDSEAVHLSSAFARDAAAADAFSKLSAYEARIERSLYKALSELHALQGARPLGDSGTPDNPQAGGEEVGGGSEPSEAGLRAAKLVSLPRPEDAEAEVTYPQQTDSASADDAA